jgi:hypothetical protein
MRARRPPGRVTVAYHRRAAENAAKRVPAAERTRVAWGDGAGAVQNPYYRGAGRPGIMGT